MRVRGAFVEYDEPSPILDGPIVTPESVVALIWISSVVWGPLLLMYSQNPGRYNLLLQQLPRALAVSLGYSQY